jgi:hypothetical protein
MFGQVSQNIVGEVRWFSSAWLSVHRLVASEDRSLCNRHAGPEAMVSV